MTVAAGVVLVFTGVAALIRALFRLAITFRDNTAATSKLTDKLEALITSIDGRFDRLAARVTALERRSKP